jgi:hypothetical protein
MSSLIIAFILAHWEDILIAFSIAATFLLLDLFVVHKGHKESGTFDATDRLFSYLLFSGVFIIALILLNHDSSVNNSFTLLVFGLIYSVAFVILVVYNHSLKDKKYKVAQKSTSEDISQDHRNIGNNGKK